jgi:hypothetical protein
VKKGEILQKHPVRDQKRTLFPSKTVAFSLRVFLVCSHQETGTRGEQAEQEPPIVRGSLEAGGKPPPIHTDYIPLLWFRSTYSVLLHMNYVSKSCIAGNEKYMHVILG